MDNDSAQSIENEQGLRAAWSAATRLGDVEALAKLLDAGVDINWRDGNGGTAMDHLARHGPDEAVALLIKHGAGIHMGINPFDALIQACCGERLEIMRMLLEAGADPNLDFNNEYRLSPLRQTIHYNFEAGVNLLLSFGAKITNGDFLDACQRGQVMIVRALIEAGANPHKCEKNGGNAGRSGLSVAAEAGRDSAIVELLAQGVDPDIGLPYQMTGLTQACWFGHHSVVQTLLDAGASLETPRKGQRGPRECAEQRGHNNIVALIDAAVVAWDLDQGTMSVASHLRPGSRL
jgi:ankyrin repeat protein